MALEIQIQSLVFSLVYGMFFALIFNLLYKYLFSGKTITKLLINTIFVTINVFLYFELLCMINEGIIHSYFILMLVMGFIIGNAKSKVIRKYQLGDF